MFCGARDLNPEFAKQTYSYWAAVPAPELLTQLSDCTALNRCGDVHPYTFNPLPYIFISGILSCA